jgi:hypothetical protein
VIDPRDLAAAIRRLRGDRLVEECARRGSLRPCAWRAYEAGETLPRRRSFLRVARGLEVSLVELQEAVWTEWAARIGLRGPRPAPEPAAGLGVLLMVVGGTTIVQRVPEGG